VTEPGGGSLSLGYVNAASEGRGASANIAAGVRRADSGQPVPGIQVFISARSGNGHGYQTAGPGGEFAFVVYQYGSST